MLAMASYPTFNPRVFVGRVDPRKLAPLLTRRRAEKANYPALNRALAGAYPPGSTFKPVTALAAMRGAPRLAVRDPAVHAELHVRRRERRPTSRSTTGTPTSTRRWTMPTALAASCDTYFYELGERVLRAAAERGHPLQDWAQPLRVRRSRPASTLGPEATRPHADARVAQASYFKDPSSTALEAGLLDPARDRPGRPARDAAADGALLRDDRERRPARHAARRSRTSDRQPERRARSSARPTRPAPQPIGVDPSALAGRAARASTRDARRRTARRRASSARFPVEIAGKTGTAEKWSDAGLRPHTSTSRGGAGTGPYDDPEIVVCALIENGGHGGIGRGAGRAEGVRAVLPRRGGRSRSSPSETRLMDRRLRRHARRARARSAAPARAASAALRRGSLDWILARARSPRSSASASGRSRGITRARRRRGARTTTSSARRVYAAVGARRAASSRSLVDPDALPPLLARRSTSALLVADRCSSFVARRRARAARGAGSTSASFSSSRRSSASCSSCSSSRASSPSARGRIGDVRDGAADARRSRSPRSLLVFVQPDLGTALVYGAALARDALPRRHALAAPRRARAAVALTVLARSLWALPAAGVNVLKPYQATRLTAFANPRRTTRRARRYNVDAVDHARSARAACAAAASTARRRRTSTTCPSTRPTSPSPRSPSSAASSARRCCSCSTCSSSGAGSGSSRSPPTRSRAIVAGGIVFALLFQVFVNVGMTMGIAPVTGIPLPFVCVGGSSMITNLLAMGVLLRRSTPAAARRSR